MNIVYKSAARERRIASLQKQVDRLTEENNKLLAENQSLSDKVSRYQVQMSMVDELRKELSDSIAESIALKEQYLQIINEGRQMKKEYSKRFKSLINRLKSSY